MNNISKLEKDIQISKKKYKLSSPYAASVIDVFPLNNQTLDTAVHIVINIENSQINYIEGQSIGIIPPGKRSDGRLMKPRLYSIASARTGEKNNTQTLSLTIKRLIYKIENEYKYGLCSDYLSKIKPNETLLITGPTGRILNPPKSNEVDLIFVATGTGVAPVRAIIQNISRQSDKYRGNILIYLGFKRLSEALYCNDLNNDLQQLAKKTGAKISLALSREQKNQQGNRMYVGDRIKEDKELLKKIIQNQNFSFYICGLKGMEKPIEELIINFALGAGYNDIDNYIIELKKAGRWNIEVY